jgi:signal transduction histidine kinase
LEDAASGKPERALEIAREQGRFLEESWRVRKDGSTFWAGVLITRMTAEDGTLTGFSKVTRDLSAQRAAQQALTALVSEERRARAELQDLAATLEERVAARTRQLQETNDELEAFSYTVSHDLRAPLRGMQGFAQALLEDHAQALGEEGRYYAERISRSASQMDLLIQDLLSYSRLARADIALETVMLDAAVTQALERVEKDATEHGAEIRVERPLPGVRAHLATLVQVLANLLSNAIKFVRPGEAPRVLVRAEQDGPCVRLWVEDRGIGIQPEHQRKIFGVFERLHGSEAYPGSGIGLAIVKKGTERMGGRVGVESEPGRGSRFWIELARAGGE